MSKSQYSTNLLQVPGQSSSRSSYDDAPPAYSEDDRKSWHSGSSSQDPDKDTQKPISPETLGDALWQLVIYDTVFIIDDSLSMDDKDHEGGKTRWEEAETALRSMVDVVGPYDSDGVDIHFLNSKKFATGVKTTEQVDELFAQVKPSSWTPIEVRLMDHLHAYMKKLESKEPGLKPVNYIIITDGQPVDEPERIIVATAKRLDKGNYPLCQVGIQFVQIGKDSGAKRYLKHLDSHLKKKYEIRDMVDMAPYSGTSLTGDRLVKILIGAINRKFDKKPNTKGGLFSFLKRN
ncbi:hypothetical protein C8J56DRAFT_897968 [Mycena floridula]|nr:hypothetical protein C8J56DRAFT_897968 [Mycena floridula]